MGYIRVNNSPTRLIPWWGTTGKKKNTKLDTEIDLNEFVTIKLVKEKKALAISNLKVKGTWYMHNEYEIQH